MSDDPILAAIGGLSRQIADLEAGQNALRSDLSGWMERVGDKFTAIHDDITVNFAAADNARKLTRDTREEMRMLNAHATTETNGLADLVSGMQRQIQRLQTQVNELVEKDRK